MITIDPLEQFDIILI